jgi:transcriptional regulator with XRE-family HTH domain
MDYDLNDTHSLDAYVGSRIRLRRKLKGLSQQALGASIGVTYQQVQKYEQGSNRVGASRLVKIAEALDVSVIFFFEGLGNCRRDRDVDDVNAITAFLASRDGVALASAWIQLGDVERRSILSLVLVLVQGPAADDQGKAGFAD